MLYKLHKIHDSTKLISDLVFWLYAQPPALNLGHDNQMNLSQDPYAELQPQPQYEDHRILQYARFHCGRLYKGPSHIMFAFAKVPTRPG